MLEETEPEEDVPLDEDDKVETVELGAKEVVPEELEET